MLNRQIKIIGTDIFISNGFFKPDIERSYVFHFNTSVPLIRVFENLKLKREYLIETLSTNTNLTGQFFHSTIRILKNSAVMIDGIISLSKDNCPNLNDAGCEAIRLQPFFLTDKEEENQKLIGKGLFERGLHFGRVITPTSVRVICICDNCKKSFSLEHFHAGFSNSQYFYSSDSKETLVVSDSALKVAPTQLQTKIDLANLTDFENCLPKPKKGQGEYKYYNPFRCPYCSSPFIDFEKYKDIRSKEYYGNKFINHTLQYIDNE
jgi:hypothetical protein